MTVILEQAQQVKGYFGIKTAKGKIRLNYSNMPQYSEVNMTQ